MSKVYFIQEHLHLTVHHGGIGNADADRIWLKLGYLPVEFPERENFSIAAKWRRIGYLVQIIRKIKKNDVVVFQFPLYAGMSKLLVKLLLRKKIKMICFITDIDGLKDGDAVKLKREINTLQQFQYFIVHNQAMKSWLIKYVPQAQVSSIEFFDFLTAAFHQERKTSIEIVFAGNLSKSLFLEHLNEMENPVRWHVYGPGFTTKMRSQAAIDYKGIIEPYDLPVKVEGSYGLVWDGESIHGSGGVFGDYMQYITHHKVSLYILAGLPVICYSGAGAAELIRKYEIGFLTDDLDKLSSLIEKVDQEKYTRMRNNLRPLSEKISKGQCLSAAMKETLDKIRHDQGSVNS